MKYTSIFEKILFLINLISSSWIYISFIILLVFLLALLFIKKISKRKCFLISLLLTTLLFSYIIIKYFNNISSLVNNIINNIFLNIYFPSAYTYLFILIIINIITIGSLLKPKGEKIYKTINGICFILTNFILTIILEIISKNKIDIFSKTSLFANTDLITLLQFSINIFIVWLISLLTIYIINLVTEKIIIAKENKELITKPVNLPSLSISVSEEELKEDYLNEEVDKKEEVITKQEEIIEPIINTKEEIIEENYIENKFIPNFNQINTIPTIETNTFDLSAFIPKKQELKPINSNSSQYKTNNDSILFNQILNNELPIIKEEKSIEDIKNTYTLNDYRIFNKMLKDIREHNQSNSITIDKNLEYRLITKYSTETYNMFKNMLKIYSN